LLRPAERSGFLTTINRDQREHSVKGFNDLDIVFSTDQGRIRPDKQKENPVPKGDGIVRVGRETKGRKGKGMTVITGVPLHPEGLKNLARQLKQKCGTGGTVKGRTIEIQGDHRDLLVAELQSMGYAAKKSGG
jgi:translation initiation factor 1